MKVYLPFSFVLSQRFIFCECLNTLLQQLEEKRNAGDNGTHRSSRHANIENDRPRSRDRDKDRDRHRDRDGHRDRDRGRESDRSRHRDYREKDREHERDSER